MLELALHSERGPVQLGSIAKKQGIPRRYLAQLAQDLRKAGLLRSVRGAHGGYALSRQPSKIRLIDILVALEGPVLPVACVTRDDICSRRAVCAAGDLWDEVRSAVVKVLQRKTLNELAKQQARKERRYGKAVGK